MKGILGTEMISKHKDGFDVINRTINPPKYYAHCKTLIQALMIRDYGINNNWKPFPKIHTSKTHEPYIHKSHRGYAILKQINGKIEYFGVFDRLKDAIAERDLLVKYNWSYDEMESLDEGNSWVNKKMTTSFTKSKNRFDRYSNW